ncbi:uncharacterized protein LOC106094772 [Stomoxys calcitrans]|uniref:Nuclear receptor-binding factor 2 MIT domain-containing protein n=1 Tax=Stomoxys calcitrans TaxID=35570 RepID=A0A1I8NR20_STOCA|nr:uncharacterized protein LOC106094772 [Stomoxys calcitrans]
MDSAPLNLAHFHERRAEKLLKRHHYDEAYKAIETSLLYITDAYKIVRLPKALLVLNTQKWDYERKLQQIGMRKQQYERMKQKEILPPQNENTAVKADIVNAQSIARSIDKTIKEFNDKYGSVMINMQHLMLEPSSKDQDNSGKGLLKDNEPKDESNDNTGKKRLSILDEHLKTDEDLPSLVPLELPSFDYSVFISSGLVENFQK